MKDLKEAPSPECILQKLGGLFAVKYLMAGEELGIFEALAAGPLSLEDLAAKTSLPPGSVRILANALLPSGLLEYESGFYANNGVAERFLAGTPGSGLRPIVRMWGQVIEQQWARLNDALRSGTAQYGWADMTGEQQAVFARGIEALTAPSARLLPEVYNFAPHQSLLDLGGGTGSFLLAALQRNPALQATLFERPEAARQLCETLMSQGISIVAGDLLSDPIPAGFDAILLANVIHLFSPAVNQQLLSRIRSTTKKGTRLLLVDFWMDPDHRTPEFGALLAGEFLIVSGGTAYSAREMRDWLEAAGWRWIDHTRLAGAASLIVAEHA